MYNTFMAAIGLLDEPASTEIMPSHGSRGLYMTKNYNACLLLEGHIYTGYVTVTYLVHHTSCIKDGPAI